MILLYLNFVQRKSSVLQSELNKNNLKPITKKLILDDDFWVNKVKHVYFLLKPVLQCITILESKSAGLAGRSGVCIHCSQGVFHEKINL